MKTRPTVASSTATTSSATQVRVVRTLSSSAATRPVTPPPRDGSAAPGGPVGPRRPRRPRRRGARQAQEHLLQRRLLLDQLGEDDPGPQRRAPDLLAPCSWDVQREGAAAAVRPAGRRRLPPVRAQGRRERVRVVGDDPDPRTAPVAHHLADRPRRDHAPAGEDDDVVDGLLRDLAERGGCSAGTVRPSPARWRRKPRNQAMPSGSRPLAGSSRTRTCGWPSSAPASASRWRIPRLKVPTPTVRHLAQPDLVQRLGRAGARQPLREGHHAQPVRGGPPGVEAAGLEDRADRAARPRERGVALAVEGRRAGAGVHEPQQAAQRRGLARAVRPEEAGDPPRLGGERHVVDRAHAAEALDQAVDHHADHGRTLAGSGGQVEPRQTGAGGSLARVSSRVALATCAALPDLDDDDAVLPPLLRERGVEPDVVVWDDPAVDFSAYALVVVRDTWDYAGRRGEFVAWAERVAGATRLLNAAPVVRANTDKRYLLGLAAAGLPVVATQVVGPGDGWEPPAGEHVVKPVVGAGSVDTARHDGPGRVPGPRRPAARRRPGGAGAAVPGARSTSTARPGWSSSAGSSATASARARCCVAAALTAVTPGELFAAEEITPREPSAVERDVAEQVLDALAGLPAVAGGASRDDLLHARVDLVHDDDGRPLLLELELVEPSLFLATSPGAAERYADAVVAAGRALR